MELTLFDALVEIIDRRWKEYREPRRRFVKAIKKLLSSLEKCHDSFLEYQGDASKANLRNWRKSLEALEKTVRRIEPTVKIFQANFWAVLSLYTWEEFFLVYAEETGKFHQRDYKKELEEIKVKTYLASIDILTQHDSHAEYALSEPRHSFHDPFSERERELVRRYARYMSENKVDDSATIFKYQGDLKNIDDADFKRVIDKLKDWMRQELKPEELI